MFVKKVNDNRNQKIIVVVIFVIIFVLLVMFLFKRNDITYDITFDNIENSYTVQTDKMGYLSKPVDPIKEGFIFLGWYVGDEKVDFDKPFNKDTILEAKWDEIKSTEDDTLKDNELKDDDIKDDVGDNKKPTNNVNKIVNVNSISLSCKNITLNIKEKKKIKAYVLPSNATNKKVTWKSSNSKVVKVDSNGNVTAISSGKGVITATSNGKTAKCNVYVKKDNYKIVWVKVDGTSIEQYKLYIKNSSGKYVSGTLQLTTIAGKTFDEKVSVSGSENIYIKSAIESVKIK